MIQKDSIKSSLFSAVASVALGAQGITVPITWSKKPATPGKIIARIETAVSQIGSHGPVPYLVLYDIGYPENLDEYNSLDGNAVLLLTACSHNREELPLKLVYVESNGKQVVLKPIRCVFSDQSSVDNLPVQTFGPFRVDSLYLLPMQLRIASGMLFVDYSKNHFHLPAAKFGSPLPSALQSLATHPTKGQPPSNEALEHFIAKEFPAFSTK